MLHAHKVNAMLEPRYIQRHGMIAGREALVQYLFNFPAQAILERHRYLPFPGPFFANVLDFINDVPYFLFSHHTDDL
jgi:hypothetical protein